MKTVAIRIIAIAGVVAMGAVLIGCSSEPATSPAPVTMTTGQGRTLTLTMQTLPDSRDYCYCELVFIYQDGGSDIYSTSPLAECSLDWWNNMDTDAVAKELGAVKVIKNGPQWWSMDEVGVLASEPVSVAGVNMVFGAHLPPGTMSMPKYEVFNPSKTQNLTWKAGKPTYQLVDPDGHVYIVQGHKIPTDEMASLGDKYKELPEGWEYRVVPPTEDMILNVKAGEPIPSVQDEFDQIFMRLMNK
jgi:hypothetical protein